MNCFYNKSMTLPQLIVLLCSLCFCSVNSQDATHNVTGPDYLVTDGTRNITLTCQSETPLVDRYVWFTPGNETQRCKTGPSENICTFTPRLEDDNSNVTCVLLDSQGVTSSRALYMVNLKYPPQSSPNITIQASQTEPLKQGEIIKCTVTGGKPRVSAVIIYCQYPDHEDQEDDVSDDDITVTSSIMVNTSLSTDVNTTCTCYASWPPESGLYTDRTVMSLQLEFGHGDLGNDNTGIVGDLGSDDPSVKDCDVTSTHAEPLDKAKVTNFTINGTTELTLNETSHSTVIFACQGDGRPPPVLRLYKQGDDTALIQAEINADTQQLVYTIDNVRGEDLATYTCEADNGFQDLSTRTVLLWVNSAPRILDNSSNFASPPTLPPEGLTFSLVAYPTPQFNDSYFLGTSTKPEPASENTFEIQCTRNALIEHLVTCNVTPQNVPKENVGLYEMSVTNELGEASFRFRVGTPDKAKVTNFTINGTTELTLNETSHSTVIFACQGDGRPPPVLRLYKQGDDTALIQAEINADTQQLVYTIDNVRGEDLATYTCEADNGFQDLSTRTVLLWVNYKAKVTNFTINGTTELTLNETSHSTVIFACQGDGRPPPVLRLYKQGDDTALIQAEINADTQQLVYTIDNVRGEDLATYTCEADNGFQDLSTRTRVLLWVNSAPRILDNSSNFASPPILPPKGLTFSLVAYPTPQFNGSYFLGTSTKPEPASENTFEIQCTRNAFIEHLVTCNVTPQNVPKENVGLYEMSVTNELGEASFRFGVGTPVSLPQDDDSILTVAIVVAVVGVLLVIGIIVVIVICLKRRKLKAGHKGHHDSRNRNQNDGTTVPVTMTATPVAQVSLPDSNATDTNDKINDSPVTAGGYITVVDVGKKGQRSTDSKEYANVDELTKNGNKQGSNNAVSTLSNNVQTPGYENLTLDPIDAPKVMTTAEKPDIVASIPEDSAEETNRPESEAYAVVAPKPKGDNHHIA